ncbi:MAG: 4Fe-4S binding protein [Anaeromyxobacter sp.]
MPSDTAAPPPASPAADDAAPALGARWTNPWRHLPRVRWAVQLAYLGFTLLVGWQFSRFVAAALASGPLDVERPPAVEGFLPIAALVGLKRFLLTRYWDQVHPAGLTLLLAALATAFVARKGFCSWVCPVGTLSRLAEEAGKRLLWRRRGFPVVPRWLDLPLCGLKYLLLAFFAVSVFVVMPLPAAEAFLGSPYNVAADAKMLAFFTHPSSVALSVMGGLVALSLVVKHAWCRWLCPYGALLGLSSLASPVRIRRDPDACNDCRACTRACPAAIPVHSRLRVLSAECTGCMSCVAACTTADCLGVTGKGQRRWSAWWVPALVLGTMLGFWAVARLSGFWHTDVPAETFRQLYRLMGVG